MSKNMATTSLGSGSFANGKSQGQGTTNTQQGNYKQAITTGASKANNQPIRTKGHKLTEYGASAPSIKKGNQGETDR